MSRNGWIGVGVAAVAVIILLIWAPWASDDEESVDTTTTTEAGDTTTTVVEETTTTAGEETTTTEGEAMVFLAGQVTDTGGVDDKGFNQTAYAGLQRAESDLGAEISLLESQSEADYETNINSFIDQGCDVIITVGFLLGQATQDGANANQDTPFSIVDFAYGDDEDGNPVIEANNVLGQIFSTEQGAFMAGYLAAATSQTGFVGSFGGINIPPVTVFMDGFEQGVNYHNEQKGTSVAVLG